MAWARQDAVVRITGTPMRLRLALEFGQQGTANSVALLTLRHAHRLQPQRRLRAPELAEQLSGHHETDKLAVLLRRELDMQRGLGEGCLEATLKIESPGATDIRRVQRDHRIHILRRSCGEA